MPVPVWVGLGRAGPDPPTPGGPHPAPHRVSTRCRWRSSGQVGRSGDESGDRKAGDLEVHPGAGSGGSGGVRRGY